VSPSELESVILQHPGVRDVAVIGVPDKVAGDLPKAYVVCKPLQCVSERDISEFVSGQYSREGSAVFKKNLFINNNYMSFLSESTLCLTMTTVMMLTSLTDIC